MSQPPPTHIPTGIKIVRLFLTCFGGGPAEEGPEPAFATTETEEEVAEDWKCVGPIGEVYGAGDEELIGDGDSGEEREAALDRERGD